MTTFFEDLVNAGLPVLSATDIPGKPKQATFSRSLSEEESELYHDLRSPTRILARQRKEQAKLNAKNIPEWASWSEDEALQWLLVNIGTPLETNIPPHPMTTQQIRNAIVLIVNTMKKQYEAEKAMARMIIAIRNELWSDLPDEEI